MPDIRDWKIVEVNPAGGLKVIVAFNRSGEIQLSLYNELFGSCVVHLAPAEAHAIGGALQEASRRALAKPSPAADS
jgi:hypothetical protein